jgi:hypothetical protein
MNEGKDKAKVRMMKIKTGTWRMIHRAIRNITERCLSVSGLLRLRPFPVFAQCPLQAGSAMSRHLRSEGRACCRGMPFLLTGRLRREIFFVSNRINTYFCERYETIFRLA